MMSFMMAMWSNFICSCLAKMERIDVETKNGIPIFYMLIPYPFRFVIGNMAIRAERGCVTTVSGKNRGFDNPREAVTTAC